MIQIKKTILTLVALLAVTTGAWATTVTWVTEDFFNTGSAAFTKYDVTVTPSNNDARHSNFFYKNGVNTFTSTLGNFTKIEIVFRPSSSPLSVSGWNYEVIEAVQPEPEYEPDYWEYTSKLTWTGDAESVSIQGAVNNIKSITFTIAEPSSGPEVAWNKAEKTGTFTMPGGNVTLEPEYYPQAALTAAPTAINDVPATTDGAIVKAGTVANIGDQWKADVPTAEKLTKGEAYVYYYVRGNDSDTDEENFSDGDILAANALTVTIAAEPTKVTLAANDKTMGTVEVAGESKVEWTADTWKGWTADVKKYTVDDITMTSSESAHIREYTSEDQYNNSLFFFVRYMIDDATVTFSTTGDPFSRIEFTMIGDYSERNPNIIPNDNWTFEGKSAVWEGEATKSLTLQSCSTNVSKITFYKGAAIPDGVTVNGDGTFTVAKTATVKLKATPAEGYKFLYWEDDQTNTNPVREVTIESGMADMTYKAVFAEILYNVTFAEGTNLNEWTADPNTDVKKGETVTVTYTGSKKVIGVKAEKKKAPAETTVTLTTGEIGDLSSWGSNSKTINGITIAVSGDAQFHSTGLMDVHGDAGPNPDPDQVYAVGTFTFTSSAGKIKRIDINHNGGLWYGAGEGWPGSYQVYDNSTFTWSGIPAASVTLNGSHKGFEFVFTIEPTN